MSKAEQPEFDLKTSEGGRGYVAHLFTATLKRYDFASYIKEHLAADFACTLAAHLAQAEAAALAREAELREELAKVKERAAFWYETSGKAIDAMTMVTVQRDSLQLRINASSGLINPFDLEYSQELCDSMLANISALVAQSASADQPHDDLLDRFPEINFSNYGQQEVEALQAWAFEAHDHIKTVGLADQSCVLPPTGWSCARGAGHEGPCAAVLTYPPVPYDRKLPDDQRGEISQDDKVFRCGAAAKMALPERRDISSVSCNSALYEIYHGWNSCLDAIAKLNGVKS